MSYILDALRRAEAERERGEVPGLQSQQHPVVDDDATPRPRPMLWAVIGLSVALCAVVGWMLFGAPGTARAPADATARAPIEGAVSPPAIAAAPAPLVPPAATLRPRRPASPQCRRRPARRSRRRPRHSRSRLPNARRRPVPHIVGRLARRALRRRWRTPPRVRRTAPPRRRERGETTICPDRPRAAATATATARGNSTGNGSERAAASTQGGAEARVYKPAELPDEIRRDLPKLTIGGSSYSHDAASRMVMINGQVFHEGDRLASDLVLERIRLKSAVLAFKGWRYEIAF